MKRTEFILKAMTVFGVCLMLWAPVTVKADLILEPIEEELVINDKEEKSMDAAIAGVGVTALVAATGTMIAVIFKKKKNDEGEE